MLGYTRMLDEIRDQGSGIGDQGSGASFPDAIFVQGGVGGLLCAVASWCAFHRPDCNVISVEPADAACLQASARAGGAVAVEGPLRTAMAGLRNREVSPLAFESLLPNVAAFMAIDDAWAAEAMRALHAGGIDAGASGAAALGGLLAMTRDAAMAGARAALGLDASANVLVIVSEGVTDPVHWSSVVSVP